MAGEPSHGYVAARDALRARQAEQERRAAVDALGEQRRAGREAEAEAKAALAADDPRLPGWRGDTHF